MPTIEATSISKSFGGVRALHQASFAAELGEVHALVGENGAGKSTMIKILSGLYPPDSGQVRLDGTVVSLNTPGEAMRLGIGTVFQELTLLPAMTVAENLLLRREPRRAGLIRRGALPAAAQALLDAYDVQGIQPLELIANLSLGQRQVVEIVKTVSRRPRILFMDEPTSALAEREVAWLIGLIGTLRAGGTCIVFTSHRWNEIKGIADRITIFRNGESIGVFQAADLSEEAAVEVMTGRKLGMYYPSPRPLPDHVPVLEVRELQGRGLNGASLAADRGEILGIGGLAGQGQLELFLSLFGVQRTHGGTVLIGGKVAQIGSPGDAIRAGMGIAMVPEDRKTEGLFLPLSVRQNLTLPILSRISTGGFMRRREEATLIRQIVQRLGIRTPNLEQPAGALSGGNQQKVLIGRWLLSGAKILLLYDITRGVDVATKHDIYELMQRLSDEGRTLLFYSTDTEELAHVCHRVLVMREGRFVAELRGAAITPEAIVAASIRESGREQTEVPA